MLVWERSLAGVGSAVVATTRARFTTAPLVVPSRVAFTVKAWFAPLASVAMAGQVTARVAAE